MKETKQECCEQCRKQDFMTKVVFCGNVRCDCHTKAVSNDIPHEVGQSIKQAMNRGNDTSTKEEKIGVKFDLLAEFDRRQKEPLVPTSDWKEEFRKKWNLIFQVGWMAKQSEESATRNNDLIVDVQIDVESFITQLLEKEIKKAREEAVAVNYTDGHGDGYEVGRKAAYEEVLKKILAMPDLRSPHGLYKFVDAHRLVCWLQDIISIKIK